MKKLFFIANWKSHKITLDLEIWFEKFHSGIKAIDLSNKVIIICPPFTLLDKALQLVKKYQLLCSIGAQDVSPFDEGAYTGEVDAKQIKEFASHVIIGHSERRTYFHEDYDLLSKKVSLAKKYNLNPIFCVQGENTTIPAGVEIVAFEPVEAIGTGNPDTPEDAEKVALSIKTSHSTPFVLYGGSVTPDNVSGFIEKPSINGVLVGTASLDPQAFLEIIANA